MDTNSSTAMEWLMTATQSAHNGLLACEMLLRNLSDADLHRADPEGGWTVAQIVSHIHLCGLLWIADLERMRHAPEMFMFREVLGHDAVGALPLSSEEVTARIASTRHALGGLPPRRRSGHCEQATGDANIRQNDHRGVDAAPYWTPAGTYRTGQGHPPYSWCPALPQARTLTN